MICQSDPRRRLNFLVSILPPPSDHLAARSPEATDTQRRPSNGSKPPCTCRRQAATRFTASFPLVLGHPKLTHEEKRRPSVRSFSSIDVFLSTPFVQGKWQAAADARRTPTRHYDDVAWTNEGSGTWKKVQWNERDAVRKNWDPESGGRTGGLAWIES